MSEPSSPEEAADAVERIFWDADNPEKWRERIANLIRERDRAVRREALEEAIEVVRRYCDSPTVVVVAGEHVVAAIRALKQRT